MNVIKVGGNELDEPGFMSRLAEAVGDLAEPTVLVHGGGKAIGELQEKLGIPPQKIDGLRVTDEASLAVAQMVLSGSVNKRLVQALMNRGVQAIGLSGVDGGLLRCTPKRYHGHDLGLVGQITQVNTKSLETLLASGFVVVISPISLGLDGAIYNINADEAAGAIASALRVKKVWFISNVSAVLDQDRQPIEVLYHHEASRLIADGVISNGMIPKVRTALEVVASGVPEVFIADIGGLVQGAGTRFIRSIT